MEIVFLSPTITRLFPQASLPPQTHIPRSPVEPTHAFDIAPDGLRVLIVSGEARAVDPVRLQPVVDSIRALYSSLRYAPRL